MEADIVIEAVALDAVGIHVAQHSVLVEELFGDVRPRGVDKIGNEGELAEAQSAVVGKEADVGGIVNVLDFDVAVVFIGMVRVAQVSVCLCDGPQLLYDHFPATELTEVGTIGLFLL